MTVHARPGDPILSVDGKEIVAKWKVGLTMAYPEFSCVVYADEATALAMADMSPQDRVLQAPRIVVQVAATFPDRTYWQLAYDVPVDDIRDGNNYFTHPGAEVDPSNPRGMIAAIDELMVRHKPERYGTADWLHMIRSYYVGLADRSRSHPQK